MILQLDRRDRAYYLIAAALGVSGLFHVAVLLVTGGSWEGPLSFRKPATFGLSFGLTLATVTWVATYLPLGRRTHRWALNAFAAACVLEVALITVQAWRGVPSHFNLSTTVDGVIARVLAVGGAVLIGVVALLTAASWRTGATSTGESGTGESGTAPSMRLAVRAGLTLLSAAMLTGAAMIAIGVTLVIGGDQQAAYTRGGVLKPVHGVAMHAVLVLPALAWLLARTRWPESRRVQAMRSAVAAYVALTLAALIWSL